VLFLPPLLLLRVGEVVAGFRSLTDLSAEPGGGEGGREGGRGVRRRIEGRVGGGRDRGKTTRTA